MEEIRQKIQTILEETVNTQLAAHNGSASLSDFADGVAWIRFHGACANCMSSSETLEDVVKESLLRAVPEAVSYTHLDVYKRQMFISRPTIPSTAQNTIMYRKPVIFRWSRTCPRIFFLRKST